MKREERKHMNSSLFVLHSSLNLYHFLGEDAFQFLCRESEFELSLDGNADSSRLFRNDDGDGITALRDTQGCTVTESQFLRDIEIMAHRQDTAGSHDSLVAYHHGTIMQRRVLEEDVLYQTLIDFCIYLFARMVQRGLKMHYRWYP